MKSKFYALALALACSMTVFTANAADWLTVTDAQGNKTSFALSTSPKVTFTSENLVLTAGDQTVEYPLADYSKFEFTDDNQTTGIKTVDNTGSNAVFSFGESVHGEGLKAGSRVSVYSVGGQMVGSATVSANGSVDIPLNGGNGVFIVRSASKSFKFIKK